MKPEIIALIVALASAFGTGFVTFFYSVFEDVIKAKLAEWGIYNENKRKLTDDIITICAEAQEKKYQKLPDDERRIYIILNQLETIQSPVLDDVTDFYNLWITTATVADYSDSKEHQEFVTEMIKATEKSRKKLIKSLASWKK